ncbi:MAG: hypothetical protein HOV81_07230, partial [Kofleriaceae bacterium]|nr:hypothetical protein [Kofleriaceae bacterium]
SRYNPDCPQELDDIVMMALARNKELRWASASEMREPLDELRQYYGEQASAREVVQWMQTLRDEPRVEHDGEHTEMLLDAHDMFEVSQSDPMGFGSHRGGAYAEGSGALVLDVHDEHTEIAAEKPKFRDSDTVIQSFLDRKP